MTKPDRSPGAVPSAAAPGDRGPLTPRGEQKRTQILDAAAEVIAERGYAGTTLAEIAARAGTHAGSLYYHFASREELVEEVLQRGVRLAHAHVRAAVAALPDGTSARDRLSAAVREHLRFQLETSSYARAAARATGNVPDDMRARINASFRLYGRYLDGLVADAVQAGAVDPAVDRHALRMLVIGAANWAPEWFRPDGALSAEQVADLLDRMLFRGVGIG